MTGTSNTEFGLGCCSCASCGKCAVDFMIVTKYEVVFFRSLLFFFRAFLAGRAHFTNIIDRARSVIHSFEDLSIDKALRDSFFRFSPFHVWIDRLFQNPRNLGSYALLLNHIKRHYCDGFNFSSIE